jgi:PAS domain S-box-containing protein
MGSAMNDKPDILIVDDQPDNLRLLTTILSQHGYRVRKALSGHLAITAVDTALPDAILLDITMSDMDGYDICERFKANPRTAKIPIIFLSALDDSEDKVRAFRMGAADYVTKPFHPEEVLARLNHQLTIQRQQRALHDHIAQQQIIEQDLWQSQAILSSVLDSSTDGIAAFEAVRDADGSMVDFRWLVANTVVAGWVGKSPDDLIGQLALEDLARLHEEDFFEPLLDVIKTGRSLQYELCHNRTVSSPHQIAWLQIVAVKLGDGIAMTFRDITVLRTMVLQLETVNRQLETRNGQLQDQIQSCDLMLNERLEAEAATRKAEERYRSIFEHSIEGIYQLSADRQYLDVNPSFAHILGYSSPQDFLDHCHHPADIYVQPKRQSELAAYMQRYDSVPDFESQVYCKDRSTIWVSENIWAVRDDDGTVSYYEGMISDVTDRKESERELRVQRLRSERLLLNILPQRIAERLKRSPRTIADSFTDVTVLFADLVNFTQLATRISPQELVELLNKIFSTFDELVEQYNLEKVKTVGDEYMAVSGMPVPRLDHAEAMAELALDMQAAIAKFRTPEGESFKLRIGMNTGPVVAGVIGTKKFSYDLWGDTVNIASRMESRGEPGRIQVSPAIYELLKHRYTLEDRGEIFIKGIGKMRTYWLTGRQPLIGIENPHPPIV